MILNPIETQALVVSRSGTVNPPNGYWVVSGVSICASHNIDILGVKFDSKLTFEPSAWYCLSCLSKNKMVF